MRMTRGGDRLPHGVTTCRRPLRDRTAHEPSDRRGRRCSIRERGATLVESAIVLIPFFLLIFGLIEGSLLLSNSLTTSHVSKAGARTASALGADLQTDHHVLKAIAREGRALNRGDVQLIVIYRATSYGAEPTATCRAGTPVTGLCNVYVAADLDRTAADFGCQTATALDGPWCPTTRKTALSTEAGGPPDFVGVWVKTNHRMVSGLVGENRVLTERSVQRVEPRRA